MFTPTNLCKRMTKIKMFQKYSAYFLHFLFQSSPKFPNGKTETVSITGRRMFARTLRRSRPCSVPVNSYPAPAVAMSLKHLMASRVCQDDFSAICRLAPCLWDMLISKHTLTKMLLFCKNGGVSFKMQDTLRFLQKQRVKRIYLLKLQRGLKQLDSKCAADWNNKKRKGWSKQAALQDLASTTENKHSKAWDIHVFQFSLSLPNGKTETVSITGRRMFARTLRRSRPCSFPVNSYPAPAVAMSLKHLMASRVCQNDFSAICRLAPCLWDMLISKHKLTEMLFFARIEGCHSKCTTPFDSCKNNGSNGSIFSSSSEVSNSSTPNVRQIETTRSGKDEANKRLYKIWPPRQRIAMAIWPSNSQLTQGLRHSRFPVFSQFSKWQNWNCFHDQWTDVCKKTAKVKTMFFSRELLLSKNA